MTAWNQSDVHQPESLGEAIARWGRLASPSILTAVGCFAGWGIVAHQPQEGHGLPSRIAQTVLTVLGAVTAAAGLLGVLFWALGPAPIL